ncbi:unnamed protein product [Lymnaea stagnalis]|uniref:Uncharacterized protein n=1 Tax=Lymnaea stagnalis TaxID=6523 RepID=A0AAV2IFH2_LYMST
MDSDVIRGKRLCHQSSVTDQGSESTNIFHSLMNSSSLRLPVSVIVIALGFYFVNIRLYPIILDVIDVFRWCFIPVTTLYLTSPRFRAVVGLLHSICLDVSLEGKGVHSS